MAYVAVGAGKSPNLPLALELVAQSTLSLATQLRLPRDIGRSVAADTVSDVPDATGFMYMGRFRGMTSDMVLVQLGTSVFAPTSQPVVVQLDERDVPVFIDLSHRLTYIRPVALHVMTTYAQDARPVPDSATMDAPYVALQFEYSRERLEGAAQYLAEAALTLDYNPANLELYDELVMAADVGPQSRWVPPQPARQCYHHSISVQLAPVDGDVWNPAKPPTELPTGQTAVVAATFYGTLGKTVKLRQKVYRAAGDMLAGTLPPVDWSDVPLRAEVEQLVQTVTNAGKAAPTAFWRHLGDHLYGHQLLANMRSTSPVSLNIHSLKPPGPDGRLETARLLPVLANKVNLFVTEMGCAADAWIQRALASGMSEAQFAAAQRGQDMLVPDQMTQAEGALFVPPAPATSAADVAPLYAGMRFAQGSDTVTPQNTKDSATTFEQLCAVHAGRTAAALQFVHRLTPAEVEARVESTMRATRVYLACDRVPSGALALELLELASRDVLQQRVAMMAAS